MDKGEHGIAVTPEKAVVERHRVGLGMVIPELVSHGPDQQVFDFTASSV